VQLNDAEDATRGEAPRLLFLMSFPGGRVMTQSWMERRAADLHALQATDPAQIISIYRKTAGLSPSVQVPQGVSFYRMIEAILAYEAAAAAPMADAESSDRRDIATN